MFSGGVAKKVISGLAMIGLVLILFKTGEPGLLPVGYALGHFVVDELFTNFMKRPRKSASYFLAHLIFALPFWLVFTMRQQFLMDAFVYCAAAINLGLLGYLFFQNIESHALIDWLGKRTSALCGLFVLFPIVSLCSIFQFEDWRFYLGLLLFVNYSMDTFGWFFGKTFGRRKLWEAVSPNKTFEGLYGGIVGAMVVGAIYCYLLIGNVGLLAILGFGLLALFAQLGDLFQSKIKRQFAIKDSSSLIPGHGGIYDRIDSLLFVAPFFIVVIQLIYYKI